MSKASVHEDGEFGGAEDEIRFAENARVAPPAGDAVLAHQRDEVQYRRTVAPRVDARHNFAALRLGENVGHFRRRACEFAVRPGVRRPGAVRFQ